MAKEKRTKKTETMNVYILLDRSASMRARWDEALGSINAYVDELGKDKNTDAYVTVAAFDAVGGIKFDILRKDEVPKEFKDLSDKDATPRGNTPLYDAIGRTMALAEKDDNKKTVIVIMTDGEENASRELTRDDALAIVKKCKKKNWPVVFLGADFDAFGQSASVGVSISQTINTTAGNYGATMRSMAGRTMSYGATGMSAALDASDADRDEAVGKK